MRGENVNESGNKYWVLYECESDAETKTEGQLMIAPIRKYNETNLHK